MAELTSKLAQLAPRFGEILKAAAGLGMSVGVLHHGQVVYTSHFGQREVSSAEPPDNNTMYYIASLTKAITGAAAAILVQQGKIQWDTPLAEYFPEFKQRDDEVGRKATLVDVLSHRTGLTGANALWIQRSQEFMMPKEETVRTASYLKLAVPFRQRFSYNNWGYGVVTALIEQVTGESYGKFVQKNIFDPLGLERITVDVPNDSNVATANMVRTDGSIHPIKPPPNSDETGLAGAGAGKASLSDLLSLYKCFLSTYEGEQSEHKSPGSPLQQVRFLFEEKVQIGDDDIKENAYSIGWVKTVLPRRLGTIGVNVMNMGQENMPVIGSTSPGTTVLHHHGNLVGALSSIHMIPQSKTAIVVLTNTFGFSDAADWVGQLILQTLIGEEPHDYVALAEESKAAQFKQYADLTAELESGRSADPTAQELSLYCGCYCNSICNFRLEITVGANNTGLIMKVQNLDDVVYHLLPYDSHSFYWPADREKELCTEMMFPWPWAGVHKITFEIDAQGSVRGLTWGHDNMVEPELFLREDALPDTVF